MTGPDPRVRVIELEVPAAVAGERLDRVVALETGCSRSAASDLVHRGAVQIDGEVTRDRKLRLDAGQQLRIEAPDVAEDNGPSGDLTVTVDVVHLDPHVIVVDKRADQVVHPGAGHARGTLVSGLLGRFPEIAAVGDPARPGIVHRLDRGTSGLLVVARSAAAYERLVPAFASHDIDRRYRALVWGRPEATRGTVDAPIGRSHRRRTAMAVVEDGKPARTHYQVVVDPTGDPPVTELECRLETGRTHQIRVHLASIGLPVVGDERYGGARRELRLDRLWLHAHWLRFDHPVTGERLEFHRDVPDDLQRARDRYR